MAKQQHLDLIKQGVDIWNKWRQENRDIIVDLTNADLSNIYLHGANLKRADLRGARLWRTDLSGANLYGADLSKANPFEANLRGADLREAHLPNFNYFGADLSGANFSRNDLRKTDLHGADLSGANFSEANLSGVRLANKDLKGSKFTSAHLNGANFSGADLSGADLSGADLSGANFSEANLSEAKLSGKDDYGRNFQDADSENPFIGMPISAGVEFEMSMDRYFREDLSEANLTEANLQQTNLSGTDLGGKDLKGKDLRGANLSGTNLSGADLSGANLSGANLNGTNLIRAILIGTKLENALLTNCLIYGISAWDVQLDGAGQFDLIITPPDQSTITIDNLKIAQFVYLLLNNKEIREVIDTLTTKAVLILGRFIPRRKAVLDAIKEELRKQNYLPILFDFEKPASRDITETISTLAHLVRFVIADITDAKSIPQELTTIIPNLPSVPILTMILNSQHEYGMFEHFMRFPWVLPIYRYTDEASLLRVLKEKVITPAEQKAKELAKH